MVGGVVVGFHVLHAYNKLFQSYSNFIFIPKGMTTSTDVCVLYRTVSVYLNV